MLDDSAPVCPWCSATLTPGATVCPSCGANLAADDAAEIPGVTEIDKSAVGIARGPAIRSRSRWRSWISGEVMSDALTESEAKAIAPPDDAVRAEMLRLELSARVARLQAEADAMLAEAAEERRAADLPAGGQSDAPDQAIETAPVESAPVESAPVESAPVESAPVESAPVETAPPRPAAEGDSVT